MVYLKKGDKEKTENYREISLLCTEYKIYTDVLRRRLEKKIEEKNLIPESQAGFRRGRGTLDNIFILNHIIQRKREEKNSKVYTLFIDLRAAFDKVEGKKLWERLKVKNINEHLIRRIKDLYEETKVTIRTRQGMTSMFKTTKEVRQGCVLSPLLFNLYIADIDKYMSERGIGGIKLGKERIWTLAYADDMVIMAKNRETLLDMMYMNTLRKYLKEKGLILNTEKTKVLVFNRKRKEKKEKWTWEGAKLEEVQNFKYLGFLFNRKGDYVDHIKELNKKGKLAGNKVWAWKNMGAWRKDM